MDDKEVEKVKISVFGDEEEAKVKKKKKEENNVEKWENGKCLLFSIQYQLSYISRERLVDRSKFWQFFPPK